MLVGTHQAIVLVILTGGPVLTLAFGFSLGWAWRAAGGLTAVIGHALNGRFGAGTLGASCTPFLQPAGPLVTRGPYGVIRHPMYAGQLLLTAGVPLWFGHPLLLVPTGALLVVLLVRMHREERLLERRHRAWRAYLRRTWRLVPFVY